jgi:hypothetical protein
LLEDDKQKLRWLDRFLADRDFESINRALSDAITEAKQADGCSNATVNRTLSLIRSILRKCTRVWEWLDLAAAPRIASRNFVAGCLISQAAGRIFREATTSIGNIFGGAMRSP